MRLYNVKEDEAENKKRYAKYYSLGHNILRLFDVLPNFPFTTSEMNHDY